MKLASSAWALLLSASAVYGVPRDARADALPCATPLPPRDAATTIWSTTAAVVPGALVHGSGSFAAGDPRTGLRLLALEGAGIGVLAAGFIPIVASGASRRLVGPAAALSVAGVGLFAISWFADLYGVLAPAGGTGAPSGIVPWFEGSVGYRYVLNPVFAYRHFTTYELDYRTGPWRMNPSAWLALDDANSRLRGRVAFRLAGPLPRATRETGDAHSAERRDLDNRAPASASRARDGSYLDIETALTRHTFATDHFAVTTGEVSLAGRLDMGHLGYRLTGSFAEMSVGTALQAYSYEIPNAKKADLGELLLVRFAYGMYVGFPGSRRGEFSLYYDHRHDGYAAGLKIAGLGSGVAGHFGAVGRYYLTDNWGLAVEAAAGSAYVTGLSILFRQGDPR